MLLGAVLISGQKWLFPAAAFVVVAGWLLWWSYRRAPASPGLRAACVGLKLIGLLALAACLLEPLWTRERARPGSNFFVVLADNSQGLQIKDRGANQSRGEQLRALLATDGADKWQAAMEENFQVRRYLFDTRLQSTRDFAELSFDGRATALASALRTIGERFQGQPLAGVLLLTDGNATDLTDGTLDATGLPPVYPVVFGTDDAGTDVAVEKVGVSQTVFEDAPVTIQGEVSASGLAGGNLVAQLVDVTVTTNRAGTNLPSSGEKVVVRQTLKSPRDGENVPFRFQVKPDRPGLSFYRLRVTAEGGTNAEATLVNNSRALLVDRGRGPYRILYVSGRPNWEFKFLNRALVEDDQVQLVGLIRVARREAKFEFRGRAGESSNPLFRGFGNQSKEEIERYDQPVLVRLNTRDEFELRGGFPKLPEDLYDYHAVILDDLEAEFFTPDQMTLVQKFVSERGGGFLMLGGAESFREGKYHRTPIGDLLPVYLDGQFETPAGPPGELRLAFTREGWLQPWARLRNNEPDEKTRLADVAPFGVLNKVRGAKPGASVIATVSDGKGGAHPALAAQRFGHGRVGAVLLGDIWHWGFKDEANQRDMAKFWRQLARWLVADVPRRIDLQTQARPGDPDNAVLLQVRAKDKKFLPIDNATVSIVVKRADAASTNATNGVRLTAEASTREPGLFEAVYVPRETGGYHAEAVVTAEDGKEAGRAEAGWTSDPAAEEFRSLKPNRALLEGLAKRSGGEIVAAGDLEKFAAALPNKKAPITESWTSPLWHQAGVFLFALACFVAEWGLRRWRGLA